MNPFPGPQPYRASDRDRFYGREDLAGKLEATILAARCVTVHGPSGAGKSSLVQAAVLPSLIDSQDVRVARVDAWPEGEEPSSWLARTLFTELKLGELPADIPAGEAVLSAAKRSARASSRLLVVYLDQIEQLFFTGRTIEETEPFFACLQQLVELPLRNVRVILSLREDYLGRFRDRLRDRGRALDHSFRVGPLTVAELTSAVCQAAAAGRPPQRWSAEQMRALMLQVRSPGQAAADDAEAQSAYAQIVCRALFQQRAAGDAKESEAVEAEPILLRYLETTLSDLGPSRDAAQRLLEDHLVSADGSRTLRTEKELMRVVPRAELAPILKALEGAAILHAEEHQGSRYFEIGHDWLARKVFEERQAREAREEQRRREEEQRREAEQRQREAAERLAKARRQQRLLGAGAGVTLAVAAVIAVLALRANEARKKALELKERAEQKEREAKIAGINARDQSILAGYLALSGRGERSLAMKLLPEVTYPERRVGWFSYASDALSESALYVTLRGHTAAVSVAVFDRSGERVLTASRDWDARVWKSDGTGVPVVLEGHQEAITDGQFSPDGQRVLTVSADGTARVWGADGKAKPVELKLKPGAKGEPQALFCGAFSPDGKHVAVAGEDRVVHIHDISGGEPLDLTGPGGPTGAIRSIAYLPDGAHLLTGSDDGALRSWDVGSPAAAPKKLGDHKGPVMSITVSEDGAEIVTTSGETLARLFAYDGKAAAPPRELLCASDPKDKVGRGEVVQAAISRDGKLVATACSDGVARVFKVGAEEPPMLFQGATSAVTSVAFSPDGQHLATASLDGQGRVYPIRPGSRPVALQGHGGAVTSIVWSDKKGGRLLLTASADGTAKQWNAEDLRSIYVDTSVAEPFHNASLSADGKRFVAVYSDRTVRVHSLDGEREAVALKGHETWVASAALSPDGKRVVTAGFDRTARVWSADGQGEPVVLKGHKADLHFASFSGDGKRVVTAAEDGAAMVWDADKGAALATLSGHEDWLTYAAFSPDGGRVVTASHDQTARVWSADGSGKPVILSGHRGVIRSAVFDIAGKRVLTASEDGSARVWSADGTGQPIEFRGRDGGGLRTAVWSADEARIAASSEDGFIYLWATDDSKKIVALRTSPPDPAKPPIPAVALQFVDGGQSVLALLADGTTHKWLIDKKTLIDRLKTSHKDCLPPDVRKDYLDESPACAEHAFALCESEHKRRPAPAPLEGCEQKGGEDAGEGPVASAPVGSAPPPLPPVQGSHGNPPDLRWVKPEAHVKVIVTPGNALVEIGGVPVRRRDGVVELLGKEGDTRLLRVSRGDSAQEQAIKIVKGPDGSLVASPGRVDKAEPVAGKGKKTLKPGEGDFSALMPGDDN